MWDRKYSRSHRCASEARDAQGRRYCSFAQDSLHLIDIAKKSHLLFVVFDEFTAQTYENLRDCRTSRLAKG